MTNAWLERLMERHRRGDYGDVLRLCELAPTDRPSQIRVATIRASALLKLDRADEALGAIESALQLGARAAELCRLAATICARQRKSTAACAWINQGLEIEPGSQRLLELRGRVVADMHLLSGVHEQIELSAAQRPESLEARERVIQADLGLCLFEAAGEHLAEALARHPASVALLLDQAIVCIETERPDEATAVLEQALVLTADTRPRQQIVLLFIKAGALTRAVQTLEANRALAPSHAEVALQSGFVALWQGDAAAAKAWCEDMEDGTPGLNRLRAAIALVEERYADAVDFSAAATIENPMDGEAHALRGAALFWLDRLEEAEASARRAMQGQREWSPGVHLLEVAAHVRQQSKITRFQVSEVLTLLAPLWPEMAPQVAMMVTDKDNCLVEPQPVLAALGEGLRKLSGNFSSAATFVDTATAEWRGLRSRLPARMACVRVFDWVQARPVAWVAERMRGLAASYPESPYVHTHTAELWLWAGEYSECENECRKALELSRTDGTRWAWVGLGAALMLQERYAEALAVFAESDQISPPGSPLLAYRGETLRRQGDLVAATADLREALRLSPARVSAWINLGLIAAEQGDETQAHDIYARLQARMPELVVDIEQDLAAADTAPPSPAGISALFAHALAVMRGNRSSNRVTYFLRDGLARVLPTRALE